MKPLSPNSVTHLSKGRVQCHGGGKMFVGLRLSVAAAALIIGSLPSVAQMRSGGNRSGQAANGSGQSAAPFSGNQPQQNYAPNGYQQQQNSQPDAYPQVQGY